MIRGELETFLDQARERSRPVPRFVEREMRRYLECGVLAYGFLRVHCDDCGNDRLVGFSCKGRGFCPSCGGRRMADTAAHLVDRVLPVVPVRQWVLSLPFGLRYRLAYDANLLTDVLQVFVRAVFASLRRRALRRRARGRLQPGAVTFVQRAGDALNLNVHFHTLVLDGVYEEEGSRHTTRFHVLPPPTNEEVEQVARRTARGIVRLMRRRGLDEADAPDIFGDDEPLLAALYAASVAGRTATGRRAGQGTLRLGDRIDVEDFKETAPTRCSRVGDLSLHANVAVPARDRKRLERLCRYAARPPLASRRLFRMSDGRLRYRLKRRWRDGTTHVVFAPHELVERLAALVPPPRAHQVRYHGVLGPCATKRAHVIPAGSEDPADRRAAPGAWAAPGTTSAPETTPHLEGNATTGQPALRSPWAAGGTRREPPASRGSQPAQFLRPRRYSWAVLLKRVFAVDVLQCDRCGGRLRILAAIHPTVPTAAILGHLGLPTEALPNAPPRQDDPAHHLAFPA